MRTFDYRSALRAAIGRVCCQRTCQERTAERAERLRLTDDMLPLMKAVAITPLSTEYLRLAADKHYLSDVVVGGLLGLGGGLLIPRLMRRDIAILPVAGGAAVVGQF
ncbi:hypothetical protein BH11MYX3_BH11MYX3_20290 [soil metagenome]